MPFRDYSMPSPDPLSANWSYDSAIDLFSLNTVMPESFPLDIPNDMVWDAKDFPADFFTPPPDINGFAVSNHDDSLSSDLESDDQSYSPTNPISTESLFTSNPHSPSALTTSPIDILSPQPQPQPQSQSQPQPSSKPSQKRTTSSTTRRYSSSPEILSQPTPTTITTSSKTRNPPRSLSDDSARGRNAAKRAAHNIIEKRYRTNMNAKFVALEQAMCGSNSKPASPTSKSSSSASLKKSEILSNAIAYMQELQETNEKLRKELVVLNQNLQVSGGLCRGFSR